MRKLALFMLLLPIMHGTAHAGEAYAAQVNPYYQHPAQQPAQVAVTNPYQYYYQVPTQQPQVQPQAVPAYPQQQQVYAAPAPARERQINILQMNSF